MEIAGFIPSIARRRNIETCAAPQAQVHLADMDSRASENPSVGQAKNLLYMYFYQTPFMQDRSEIK